MNESTKLTIFTSQDGHTTRLGWISATTGITYCGICLGSAVEARDGEFCESCGAHITGMFNTTDAPETIRRAWNAAGSPVAISAMATKSDLACCLAS